MFCTTVTNTDQVATGWWSELLLQMVDVSQEPQTRFQKSLQSPSLNEKIPQNL